MKIKFRVWDEETSKMYCGNSSIVTVSGELEEVYVTRNNMIDELIDYKLMQYTGKKDIGSKEIYDGDIIKDCEGKIMKVIWDGDGFMLEYKFKRKFEGEFYIDKNNLKLGPTDDKRWGVRVIGNIYDNPELLGI